jgi:hypothetical protein
VIVLDKGRIAEQGAPATLIASQGRFASLLELEAAGWDWRSSALHSRGHADSAPASEAPLEQTGPLPRDAGG